MPAVNFAHLYHFDCLQQLLSMKYLDKIYDGEPCNYEMAFYEYSKQMRNSSMQKFDRLIAMKAMEHLEASSGSFI